MGESPSGASRPAFVDPPQLPGRRRRSEAFYGRVVVLVVIASVIAVGSIAYTISIALSLDRGPVPLQEWFIGSWGFLVSGERPPAQLVAIALLGLLIFLVILGRACNASNDGRCGQTRGDGTANGQRSVRPTNELSAPRETPPGKMSP